MEVCAVHVEKSCGVELCGMERERVVRNGLLRYWRAVNAVGVQEVMCSL